MQRIPPEHEIHEAARTMGIDPDTMPPHVRTKVVRAMHLAAAEETAETTDRADTAEFARRVRDVQAELAAAGVWAPIIERAVGALAPTLWKEAARHDR